MNRNNSRERSILFKYTLSGFVIGLATVLLVLFIDFIVKDLTIEEIISHHSRNPAYIILDLSPFALAFYAYLLSNHYSESLRNLNSAIKKELDRTKRVYHFVEKIKRGNTDATYKVQGDDDVLGSAVLALRDELKKNKEEEQQRREEDRQRHWLSEGLAKFGEILRHDTDNLEELSYKLISNLVQYIGANQGAFFVINDEDENDKYLEMTACYAYERRKFPDKRVEFGEGLLGNTVLEKERVYMTEVPDEYVNITSGLGKATPRCLLILPLKVNEEVHGALEIASFEELEDYVIEFAEKVAESIASTISNVKVNTKTSKLLEESRKQAEELAAKEEQMRQNMEELKATQEEADRQSKRFILFSNAVNHTMIHAEFDPDGTLQYANAKFVKKLGYEHTSEVEGKKISMFIDDKDFAWFDELWASLAQGGKHFEGYMKMVTKQGRDLWTISTYTPMRRDDGGVEKILYLGLDNTEQRQQILDYEAQIQALNRSTHKLELLPSGDILDANQNFLNTMEYSDGEIKNMNLFELIQPKDLKKIKAIWNKVVQGEKYQGQFKHLTKTGKEVWLQVTITVVNDVYGETAKIIYIAHDITIQKQMEIEKRKQTELLKGQEEELRKSRSELSKRLDEAREEVKQQFKEMKKEKLRNELTLEGTSDAIVTIDQEGNVKFFNKAAEDLWGIERDMILGRNVKKLFSKGPEHYEDFILRYLDPGKDKIVGERKKATITNAEGEDIPVIFILSMAKVEDETTYTAFIQDISDDLF
ncbi:MAG: PAS domain S-box protein [Bacteroidales bacterium]